METIQMVVALLGVVAALAVAARRIGIPYPILMVVGGLGIGFIPGVPEVELEPELVLFLFLPPILFAAAFESSPRELWRNKRPISLLAFGLVLTTTLAVAGVITLLVPSMPVPAAIALGAIVSPPDAIAVTAIAHRLGLPRRLVTILEGESLVNDATALVTYRFAVAATLTGAFSLGDAAATFVVAAVGGVLIGLIVGTIVNFLFARLDDPPVEVLVSLIAPFAAYLPAESLHLSGVLAVVSAGLWHGWRAPRIIRSNTRVLGSGAWAIMIFVVNGLAFLLVGFQLRGVMADVGTRPVGELLGPAAAVLVTVVLVRVAWVFPATYVPRWVIPGLAERDPAPPVRTVVVLGWAGMRGAVSLAAALALPIDFPQRDLIVFVTLATILATLVGQGLTLPLLIRRLGVAGDDSTELEELEARRVATEAAVARLDALVTEMPGHVPLIDKLRELYLHRSSHYGPSGEDDADFDENEAREHDEIRKAVLAAERSALIGLLERGEIGEEALRRVERDIDLEEIRERT
jgi:monovalent cation/hydrogen antiporter